MSDSQNEYSIRGRVVNEDGSWGAITTTRYHFGDEVEELQNRAFIGTNPLTQNRAHGVHEIPEGQDAFYKNSFGLIHPIGNVWSRSIEGVICGGIFSGFEWGPASSNHTGGYADNRADYTGSRLYEEIQ